MGGGTVQLGSQGSEGGLAGAAAELWLWEGAPVMVSRPAGEVSGEIAPQRREGGMAPTQLPLISCDRKYGVGLGEGSFLLTLKHLVLFSHPLARQPQAPTAPTAPGKTGWVGEVEGTELQGGGDDDDDGKEEDNNNNDSLNVQESMSSLAPRSGGCGVWLEQPRKAGRTVCLGLVSHCVNRFISVGEGGGQAGA